MKTLLLLLPLLLTGCFLGSPPASRPVEYIDLGPTPRTPAVEPSSPVPAGATPQVNLYSAPWCSWCGPHEKYWASRGWKGDGFTVKKVEQLPDWVQGIPAYHWNAKAGPLFINGIRPDQFQSVFDGAK